MGDLLEDGRQGDADGSADGVDGWSRCGAQESPASVLLDFDFAQIGQIIEDTLPLDRFTAAGGKPVHQFLAQHQCQERAEDMATDARVGFVEDRPSSKQRLGGFEGIFYRKEIAVAQHNLKRVDLKAGA